MTPEDLFEEIGDMPQVDNDQDLQPVDVINLEDIEGNAKALATRLVNKVTKIYFTKEEIKNDGYTQTIIDRAISSITLLEKMLLSNSQLQDRLIQNCCLNSGNSGLYISLTRIQDKIIDIQTQITKELNELHEDLNEIKNADLEDDEEAEEKEPETRSAFRGGKDFLKSLQEDDEES